ncbi:MAG: hypothetical protein H8E55_65510 [Pelagibacterales bacterium]|jgi:hypothetical protein|nr:hypothetical protein [Pelagibacterales bacterium]
MKKIGAIVKGKYYSLTDEQKELLIRWRELKVQKKKLSKKRKKANIKLQSIKEKMDSIDLKQKKLKPSLKKLKKDFIPTVSIGYDKRWSTYICIIKIKGGSKSFYLGKQEDIKKKIGVFYKDDIESMNIDLLKKETLKIIRNVIGDFLLDAFNKEKQKGKKKISFDNIVNRYIDKGDWDYWVKEKE